MMISRALPSPWLSTFAGLATTMVTGCSSAPTCEDDHSCPPHDGMCVVQPDPNRPGYLTYARCPNDAAPSDARAEGPENSTTAEAGDAQDFADSNEWRPTEQMEEPHPADAGTEAPASGGPSDGASGGSNGAAGCGGDGQRSDAGSGGSGGSSDGHGGNGGTTGADGDSGSGGTHGGGSGVNGSGAGGGSVNAGGCPAAGGNGTGGNGLEDSGIGGGSTGGSGTGGSGTAGSTGGSGTGGSGTGDSGTDGSDGKDGSTAPVCDPSQHPNQNACVIDEAYGVFVSTSGNDTTGSGTRQAPYRTIAKAIDEAAARSKRVYVCASSTPYDEQLTVNRTVSIFGGFDCGSWAYTNPSSAAARLAPSAEGIAMTVKASGVLLEDLQVQAKDATTKGGSSVALFASSATALTLTRVVLQAGAGAAGANADGKVNYQDVQAAAGNSGSNSDHAGGPAKTCQSACADASQMSVQIVGGKGGNGAATAPSATAGEQGAPKITPSIPATATGKGGAREYPAMSTKCENGGQGSAAPSATGGSGAAKPGTFDASGWIPADGAAGTNGGPGQGGGGGGGSAAASTATGGGGGGGGCGGCGGAGGPGGKGGGSSFGLLSYQSTIVVNDCLITSGNGGTGGRGADGQSGQIGGTGGKPTDPAKYCSGGTGGQGGHGGGGGGGAGGLSISVAYLGSPAPDLRGTTTTSHGTPGRGGLIGTSAEASADAGASTSPATPGKDGTGADSQDLALLL